MNESSRLTCVSRLFLLEVKLSFLPFLQLVSFYHDYSIDWLLGEDIECGNRVGMSLMIPQRIELKLNHSPRRKT